MNYVEIAKDSRLKCLELIFKAGTSHIGSNFSIIDILVVLFEKIDTSKDEAVLSAGWKAAAWYYFLWKKGIITGEELNSFCRPNSPFIGLVEPMNRWGMRFAGGSMGMGLSAGVALAWSKKQRGQDGRVYVIESDGGMQVGINYEAISFAKQHKLDNLTLIVDYNGLQAMGATKDILDMSNLRDELLSFGWATMEIDGHDFEQIEFALNQKTDEPFAVIANTIKGKGVSFMEGENLYHYKQLSVEEYEEAKKELYG